MTIWLRKLARNAAAHEEGIAGVEYAFLAALIAVALASEIFTLGDQVEEHYDTVAERYQDIQ